MLRRIATAVYNGHAYVGELLLRRPGGGFYLALVVLCIFVQPVAVFLLSCVLAAAHREGGAR